MTEEASLILLYKGFLDGYNVHPASKGLLVGENHPSYGKPNKYKKDVYAYEISTGNVIKFKSLLECSIFLKASTGQVSDVANQKTIYCKNHFLFFENSFNIKNLKDRFLKMEQNKIHPFQGKKRPNWHGEKISKGRKGIKFSESHIKNMSLSRIGKRYKKIIRSDGKIFNSIKEASIETNCDRSNISHVLRGSLKSIKGYSFKYYNE